MELKLTLQPLMDTMLEYKKTDKTLTTEELVSYAIKIHMRSTLDLASKSGSVRMGLASVSQQLREYYEYMYA